MESLFDLFGILFVVIAVVFIRVITRLATAASNGADAPNAKDAPAQSVAKTDAQTVEARPVSSAEKAFARMEMQRHVSARKAELQAKRERKKAARTTPSSEAPIKSQQQAATIQPERITESSTSSDRNEWMNGFDIRRAVVWAEILRPKFTEDEA